MPLSVGSIATIQCPVSPIEQGLDASNECLRPYACLFPGCTQRFKRKYTLKDHMNAHTGVKPFICPVRACRKTFTTSGNLARHKRLHPWLDAPLPCLVDGCHCVFPTEEKLQRHMLSHFDESAVHRCDIGACGRVFSTPGNLRRHWKQSHPGIRQVPKTITHTTFAVAPSNHADSLYNRDHELVEALACLFDDHEADPKLTPPYESRPWPVNYVCRV